MSKYNDRWRYDAEVVQTFMSRVTDADVPLAVICDLLRHYAFPTSNDRYRQSTRAFKDSENRWRMYETDDESMEGELRIEELRRHRRSRMMMSSFKREKGQGSRERVLSVPTYGKVKYSGEH